MLSFKNLKIAFQDKSRKDLIRAYVLFKTLNYPFLSYLLTLLLKFGIWLKLPINGIIKSTIYKQFCGGTTIKESQSIIEKLWKANIGTILDYSVEGQNKKIEFETTCKQIIESIINAKNKDSIPFCVFKATGIARFSILKKMSSKTHLNSDEKKEANEFVQRVEKICSEAYKNRVRIFIDAEESWIQKIIDEVAEEMMRKFNNTEAWVFNTIQFYRVDRINYLKNLIKLANKNQFILGIKIVRGAYYEKEKERAEMKQYSCPVHKTKSATDYDFNEAVKLCIENINKVAICVGTHNENSLLFLADQMKKNKIQKNHNRVFISQLLGMSDHISYNASQKGYNVAKYVPYGPVKELVPYLIRRANENKSISGQVNRELENLKQEIYRRRKHN